MHGSPARDATGRDVAGGGEPAARDELRGKRAVVVATTLARFINNGSTTGAVNVPKVELPSQSSDAGEVARRPHRILHFHRNVPGVLSRMHSLIAELGGNIAAEYLRTTQDIGYSVVDIDPVGDTVGADAAVTSEEIARRLRDIPETIRVRVLW